jgi:hypothetical protein
MGWTEKKYCRLIHLRDDSFDANDEGSEGEDEVDDNLSADEADERRWRMKQTWKDLIGILGEDN